MDNMDDVEAIARRERFDALLPESQSDVLKLLVVKIILKTPARDCIRINCRVFDLL